MSEWTKEEAVAMLTQVKNSLNWCECEFVWETTVSSTQQIWRQTYTDPNCEKHGEKD